MQRSHSWSRWTTTIALLALLLAGLLSAAVPTASAAGSITLSRALAGPGDAVTINGYGFTPQDTVVTIGRFGTRTAPKPVQTATYVSGSGTFTVTLTVPAQTLPGKYAITAKDFHGITATQALTVLRVLDLRPGGNVPSVAILAAHQFFVRGDGFKPGETVKLTAGFPLYNTNTVTVSKSVTADANGAFGEVLLQVPNGSAQESVTLTATGESSGRTAQAHLYVTYRPVLSVSSPTVLPGGAATINGSGFVPGSSVRISLTLSRNGSTTEVLNKTVAADGNGAFSTILTVPTNARVGTYNVVAVGNTSKHSASAALTVSIKAAVVLQSTTALPGQSVTVSGGGFSAGVPVTISATFPLYGGGSRTISTTARTNGNGQFLAGIPVPRNAAAGIVTVVAQGPNSRVSTQLRVKEIVPTISISPTAITPGQTATITGSGYLANSKVDISVTVTLVNGSRQTLTASAVANGRGQFTTRIGIPTTVSGGTFTVVAKSEASGRAPITHLTIVKLAPSIVAVPTTAEPGTQVTVNGFGFAGGQSLSIYLNGQHVGSATTDTRGQFSIKVTIPSDLASGTYNFTTTSSSGRKASVALTVNRQVSTHFYFASLYTGTGYHEYLTFLNPTTTHAQVTISYQLTSGKVQTKSIGINPHSRLTEDVNADLGSGASAGASVSADVALAVSRVVYHGTDGAVAPGVTAPSTIWYFANGNTSNRYREYVAIENPNNGPVQVAVHFLPTHHRAFTIYRTLPTTSRTTVKVNSYISKDAVGVTVTSNGPVVANRTIFVGHGMTSKIGVTSPQNTWYFAAGPANGSAHDWIGAINPANHATFIRLRAFGPFGRQLGVAQGWLKPFGRVGYLINRIAGQPNAAVILTASTPVVAEETSYVGRAHDASTDTFGAPFAAKTWAFAAANTSSSGGQSDVLVLFNPNPMPAPVVVQFMTASGATAQRTYVVNPMSQQRIDIGSVDPNAQLGMVAASNYPFVALNRVTFNNGLGSDVSIGIPL